jgi:hypothetical protein
MTWRPDIVAYHGPGCDDGFGAAFACWKRWGSEGIEYISCHYKMEPPVERVRGKDVLMVDFSFKRPAMEQLGAAVASMVVLDHHKTAQEELKPFELATGGLTPAGLAGMIVERPLIFADLAELKMPPIIALFDMNKSGARMAWEFCHPGTEVPWLIRHIEDRDLWRFALGGTAEVSAAIRTYPQTFEVWNEFDDFKLETEGRIILRGHRKNVRSFCEHARLTSIAGQVIPAVNVPYLYASDCAHKLLEIFPHAPYAAAWFRGADGNIQFSLRSEDSRQDVSEIAKLYGGGGHRNAAGFSARSEIFVFPESDHEETLL